MDRKAGRQGGGHVEEGRRRDGGSWAVLEWCVASVPGNKPALGHKLSLLYTIEFFGLILMFAC